MAARQLFVVIPAFNEETAVKDVINDVRQHRPDASIVVVDDSSRDRTYEVALSEPVHVLRHTLNLGAGAATKTGIDYAMRLGADVIVTMDADGQMLAQDISALIAPVLEGTVDIAIGTRFAGVRPDGMSRAKRILLGLVATYTRLTTRTRFTDAHNGFRALNRHAAGSLRMVQNRFAHASEIASDIHRLKLRWVEVPVSIRYTEYSKRKGQKLMGAFDVLSDLFWSSDR